MQTAPSQAVADPEWVRLAGLADKARSMAHSASGGDIQNCLRVLAVRYEEELRLLLEEHEQERTGSS